jgi:hypothetical protein
MIEAVHASETSVYYKKTTRFCIYLLLFIVYFTTILSNYDYIASNERVISE